MITTAQAQSSIKKLNAELISLNPSTLITLFEIDVSDLAFDRNVYIEDQNKIFRFHNNISLTSKSIFFKGIEYIAAPIIAEGYEVSSQGTLPTPRLAISSTDGGIIHLIILKQITKELGDLIGAKVTRIRTFAKFIDSINFPEGLPKGFSPDTGSQLPPDIYFIERKSAENKTTLQFDLSSKLDLEGIQAPGRTVIAKRCPWSYRGEGCLYEYSANKIDEIHGEDAVLPDQAPPIANDNNELITDIITPFPIIVRGKWQRDLQYSIGNSIYIERDGIKYYFVCKEGNVGIQPPSTRYWVSDNCSKTMSGCKLRWGTKGSVIVGSSGLSKGFLPFGGFPATDKVR